MPKTTVRKHSRKGTKGVKSHSRNVQVGKKKVPYTKGIQNRNPDEFRRYIDKITYDGIELDSLDMDSIDYNIRHLETIKNSINKKWLYKKQKEKILDNAITELKILKTPSMRILYDYRASIRDDNTKLFIKVNESWNWLRKQDSITENIYDSELDALSHRYIENVDLMEGIASRSDKLFKDPHTGIYYHYLKIRSVDTVIEGERDRLKKKFSKM